MENILKRAEELQEQLDEYVEELQKAGFDRQTAEMVWILLKLAELDLRIKHEKVSNS